MQLYREFFLLIEHLNKAGLPYAVIGGIAVALHHVPRFTEDIDILARPADLDDYERVLKEAGYLRSADPMTFANTNLTLHRFVKPSLDDDLIIVDLMLGHEKEHEHMIANAEAVNSYIGKVYLASRSDLITLKRKRNSPQDAADIAHLQTEDPDRKSGLESQ